MLRVGVSEVDITPQIGLRVAGMLNPPKAQGVKWPLKGRTYVFDDGIEKSAIITLDLLLLLPSTVNEIRQAVTAGTTLAPEKVMVTCTHTHRAPYTAALMDEDIDFSYLDFLRSRLVQGMADALGACQPARLKVGDIEAPGWTFNRRQIYRSPMGEQVGTQGPQKIPTFIRNEGPEDHQIRILVFENEDHKVLGGLVNFACHTTVMGGEPVYSADYAGPLTELLENHYGGSFGFLQGTAGNLWAIDTSNMTDLLAQDYMGPDHAVNMGTALAKKAIEALDQGLYNDGDVIHTGQKVLKIPQRRVTRAQVELAQWYLEKAPQEINQQEFTQKIYGHDFTFFNNDAIVQEWFARETIAMWEWQRHTGLREPAEDVEIQCLVIGGIAFVGYPGEIFSEFGLMTKHKTPFPNTFVVELANGWHGYIPTQEAFTHGGYETRLGYTSRLVEKTGDLMVSTALDLLKNMV